ncbi:MAG: serine hydrolase [Bryobacteraceae bacterium]|nr:serine hydrolase [Bryobacteraceae bacterium]
MKTLLLPLIALALLGQTGPAVPDLALYDQAVTRILTKYQIPGAALSIAKDGRLVYTRGFGVADVETREPVQPDSLFRIASVSKPLTAVGVLKLVEDGKLTLETRVLSYIGRRATADARYNDITVRHLLQHSGGLDLDLWQFDPSFPDRKTLLALGANLPPSRGDVLNFVLTNLPLAFAPGTKYAYSNVGYMFLTEVIEKASGQPYEAYMREKVLAPLGITRMRIAGSLLTERQPGEVRYWDKGRVDTSIFAGLPETVEQPYGTFNIRIFESGGGWLATMPDLVRFLTAFDVGAPNPLLRPETIRLMTERPNFMPATATAWDGLGWGIERTPAGEQWSHSGALQGTLSVVFRGVNGISLALAANHLPDDDVLEALFGDFQAAFVAANPARWPAGSTFGNYFPGTAPRIADAGVVNAATLRQGPVAAGSVVRIFGLNLTRGTVRINGAVADTLWTDGGDLNVRVPLSARGNTQFQVDNGGQTSNIVTIAVQPAAPGIFTVSRNGYGQAAALNQNFTLNSTDRPAAAGTIVVFYATGVGATPTATVGGQAAQVLYSGQAPGLPLGIAQMNVRLPVGLAAGEWPVVIKFGEVTSLSGVTLAVQ